MIYLDLETTGLNPYSDEILQIGILSEHGEILMNKYLCPVKNRSWSHAEKIHGISPQQVEGCPSLSEIQSELLDICRDEHVVIYNAGFDSRFLPKEVKASIAKIDCAMLAFAELYGEFDPNRGSFRWQKLNKAANHVEHDWGQDSEHDAISDCRATKSVWEWISKKKADHFE